MSEADAKKRIDEDVKEFCAVRNVDVYFTTLTEEHRFHLVDKLVASALESKDSDARLVANPASQRARSLGTFEAGFMPMLELLDNIAIDASTFRYMGIMLNGTGLDRHEKRLKRIAEKAIESDKFLQLTLSEGSPNPGRAGLAVQSKPRSLAASQRERF